MILHLDIETYSSIDIQNSGAYKYVESVDFEILMIAYALGGDPVTVIDLASGETINDSFLSLLLDPEIEKHAHNANFERICFKKWGYDVPAEQWRCSATHARYCGLPGSLEDVSSVLQLGEYGKLSTGKALIKYFCCPVKPTNVNGHRMRNFPRHDPQKWEEFKQYCIHDVIAERKIGEILDPYPMPQAEWDNYVLDQKINDRGMCLDMDIVRNAMRIDKINTAELMAECKRLTGLQNPNSPIQLRNWIGEAMKKGIPSLAKGHIDPLIAEAGIGAVSDVLNIRKKMSKTSIKKYAKMLDCVCYNGRAHGLFQFYGANRTGRWAGRLIQLQNLVRNKMKELEQARDIVKDDDYELLNMLFEDISDVLSQLIRTALVPEEGKTLAVSDFSSIEAKVIAWLADEQWRLDVFRSHGKIYEASAAAMFNIPLESITKDSDYRAKGKIAELALGYQGGVGALQNMGGEDMGLSEEEMSLIVRRWRKASPAIVEMWSEIEKCAKKAIFHKAKVVSKHKKLEFDCDDNVMTIKLPSGRKLYYQKPRLIEGKFEGTRAIQYWGMDQTKKIWSRQDTYGGKLVENIVQAIARDLLVHSMQELDKRGYDIVIHVHDEIGCEVDLSTATLDLHVMSDVMAKEVPWAKNLPLGADGYLTAFYKKE